MDMSNLAPYRRANWKNDLIALLLLMGFGFFINRGIEIKGLYMDDLYLWSCFGEQSFFEYIFPMGSTRFRFIYYIVSWLELWLVGTHINWLVPINILLNGLTAWTIYGIGKHLSRSWPAGLIGGIAYLMSRLSYYQISQVYGLMETMALWAAVLILYFLYRYLNSREREPRYLIGANLLYFCVCFTHERYMVLIPMLLIVLLLQREKRPWLWLMTVGNFLLVQLIRILTIGTISPAGTGGTDVADTFRLGEAMRFAFSQVAYVFGISAGPSYLSGLAWAETPGKIKGLAMAANGALALFVLIFLFRLAGEKGRRAAIFKNIALFLGFIALCIGSSSVTVRVEMRWVYVSYGAALLFLSYMYGVVKTAPNRKKALPAAALPLALFAVYGALMLPVETFYRGQFPNLYLWPSQLRYNSLAEETYERHGDAIFGKTIYILGDSYEMSEFTADTFFKVYDPRRTGGGTQVLHTDSIRDLGQITDNMLVLREDPSHNGFQDITEYVRNQKCEIVTGYYRDGWMDESARIRVMTGSTGTIRLDCVYPGVLKEGAVCELTVDGEEKEDFPMTGQQVVTKTITAKPYQTVELAFENNFYVPDAQEQRGDSRLSMLVTIITE